MSTVGLDIAEPRSGGRRLGGESGLRARVAGRRPRLIRLPLIPVVIVLVVATAGAMILLEERSFRQQASEQLDQRGAAELREVRHEVAQLRRAHETFAHLMADTPGLVAAVRRDDEVAARRLLAPMTNEAFEETTIYRADGTELLALGPPKGDRIDAELFATAIAGGTHSEAVVDPAGLVVLASTPLVAPGRTVGALVVASTLTGRDFDGMHDSGSELAFFQNGSLVATSVRARPLLDVLETAEPTDAGMRRLNDRLRPFDHYAVVEPLNGGRLVALASSADLRAFADQRRVVMLAASGLLLALLPLLALLIRRTVTRPLRSMAQVAARMRGGDYTGRVAPSRVPELDALATAVNHLAERVETQAQLEEELRQAQKMEAIGRLAGGVAHDFNNLLTAILGSSELLLGRLGGTDGVEFLQELEAQLELCEARLEGLLAEEHPGPTGRAVHDLSNLATATIGYVRLMLERSAAGAVEDVEEIREAAERAAGLTRQLLTFSRRQAVKPAVIDLNAVIVDTEKMLARVIGEHIELVVATGSRTPFVRADRGQIEQVVLNLAVNARDAMPDGGRLTLETADAEQDDAFGDREPRVSVALRVTDTGCGMDAETLAHAFEPFFTTKPPGKGTGLGLSTVYGIVTQCGGQVRAQSEPGSGTSVSVGLPRAEQPLEQPKVPAGPAAGGGSETILLVEDEPAVRKLARRVLSASGYTVLEASDPAEGLRLSQGREREIALLVTDVVMPIMSGPELADLLTGVVPDLPVLFMSGYTDETIADRGFDDGKRGFLQKPFTPDVLKRRVRELMDASKHA